MKIIYFCTVVMVCINVGNSLESSRNQSPSKERFNFFDAELLQVFAEKDKGNILVSPISIKLVLGMLMEGAGGDTAEEIRAALRLPHEEDARRKEFNTWVSLLQVNDSANILKIANRVFLSSRYTIGTDYKKNVKEYYSGSVARVNPEEPKEASRMINDWVANQTSQLIPNIVEEEQIQPNHKLFLISAVYFKGFWSRPFASERSVFRCFFSGDNKCKESLMMTETGYFNYGYISRLDAKAVVLPYKGEEFSMLLLLPSRKNNLKLLSRDLLHVSLSSILSEMKEREVFVQIPRFEISSNEDIAESLKKMQISEVFGLNANLSKIFENNFESTSVSRIYHSTKIIVNEEGTEAAAATGAFFVPLMGGTTTSFVANRPFLFFVMNSAKNSVLFAGKVTLPITSEVSEKNKNSNEIPTHSFRYSTQENTENSSPSRENGSITNATEKVTSANAVSGDLFHQVKQVQRGQSAGPKFRSIKPLLSKMRSPSRVPKERGNRADSSKFSNSLTQPSIHRTFSPEQSSLTHREMEISKRGEPSRTQKRQQPSADSIHDILFFT